MHIWLTWIVNAAPVPIQEKDMSVNTGLLPTWLNNLYLQQNLIRILIQIQNPTLIKEKRQLKNWR